MCSWERRFFLASGSAAEVQAEEVTAPAAAEVVAADSGSDTAAAEAAPAEASDSSEAAAVYAADAAAYATNQAASPAAGGAPAAVSASTESENEAAEASEPAAATTESPAANQTEAAQETAAVQPTRQAEIPYTVEYKTSDGTVVHSVTKQQTVETAAETATATVTETAAELTGIEALSSYQLKPGSSAALTQTISEREVNSFVFEVTSLEMTAAGAQALQANERIQLAQANNFTPTGGVYAKTYAGVSTPESSAKLQQSLFFIDWSQATNMGANRTLRVGSQVVLRPAPGYEVTVKVTKLAPYSSSEVYRQRLLELGIDPADTNYDPNAQNVGAITVRNIVDQYSKIRLNSGYDFDTSALVRLGGQRVNAGITFSLSATLNGQEVPVQAFIADGESLDYPETYVTTTNGDPFQLVDLSTASTSVTMPYKYKTADFANGRARGLSPFIYGYDHVDAVIGTSPYGGEGTQVLSGIRSGGTSAVPILTTNNVTEISHYIMTAGAQYFVMGVVVPMDHGDAPSSYGDATHLIPVTAADTSFKIGGGGTNDATIAPRVAAKSPYLGTVQPDPDNKAISGSQDWTGDDATANFVGYSYDEGEAQLTGGSYRTYKSGASRFSLDVIANRNGQDKAYIGAWVDFNNNGVFDADEKTSAEVTEDGVIRLVFNVDRTAIPSGVSKLGVRVRIASLAEDVENPTGVAHDGEVEDFQISIESPTNRPSATPATSVGAQGLVQEGRPDFDSGDVDIDIVSYHLLNPRTGTVTTDTTVPAMYEGRQVGTYTLDPNTGMVTFTPNKDFVGTPAPLSVQGVDINGRTGLSTYTPTVTPIVPQGVDGETTDIQGQVQSHQLVFSTGHELVTMDDNTPATFDDGTTTKTVAGEGTYTVAADGTVTFTPDKSFVGTAQGVTVVRQDVNGTKASAKYTPTVTAVTPTGQAATSTGLQGAVQTGKPAFEAGNSRVPMDTAVAATFDDGSTSKTIPGEGTYGVASDGTVTFTPDKSFTGTGQGVTVIRQDVNGTKARAQYTPTVTAVTPTGQDATSTGLQGAAQTGKPTFTEGDASVPMDDDVPATFEDGSTTKTVSGEGTYTVSPDGTVTFTPDKSFTGTGQGVTVVRQDKNGTKASAKYTPTVTAVTPTGQDATSTGLQGAEQTGKPTFTEGDASVPMDDDVPATFEDGTTEKIVPGEGTYKVASDGTVTFTPDKSFTGTGQGVTVVRQDTNGTKASAKYTPTVTAVTPTGEDATSTSLQGLTQTGRPTFTEGDASVPMDNNVPATFEDGSTTKTIPGEGAYTVNPDGRVTFTPEKTFIGTGQGVTVVRQDTNGTKASAKYTPTATAVIPIGEDNTSRGVQGVAQRGDLNFEPGDARIPLISYQFVDPNTGQPTSETTVPALKDGQQVGTYSIASDGVITLTPNKDFVGTPDAITVVATDANGTQVSAKYMPRVVAVTPIGRDATSTGLQGAEQTGKPVFEEGHYRVPLDEDVPATFEDGSTTKTIPGEGTYTVSADGTVTFTPDKSFTGTGQGVTVVRQDKNGTKASAMYTPTVTAVTPTGQDATSTGLQGAEQTGKPTFTEGDVSVPMDDDVPATFEDGTTEKVVPGEGTYTVNSDGTVTFTPAKSFTGTGQGVTVVRQDKNGTKASAKYTPTATAVTPTGEDATSTGLQGATQTGKPTFTEGDASVPMDNNVPATFEDGSTTKTIPGEGTYTVSPDGTVTFTPDKSFTGTGQGVTVVRQDKNGTKASAKYIPTATAVTPTGQDATSTGLQGAEQTGKPTFTEGDASVPMDDDVPATFEDGTTEKVVPGEGTYKVASDGTVTFTPDKTFTGTGQGATVVRRDKNGTQVSAKFIPTATAVIPTGQDTTSTGLQGAAQTGNLNFEAGDTSVPLTGYQLVDPNTGQPTADNTLPALKDGQQVGTYTVNPDGTVTFTPNKDFVGTPDAITVVATDANGTQVRATYAPTVTAVTPTGENATTTGLQGAEQTGKPTFTEGDVSVPMDDDVPATFEDGSTTKTIPGEGVYTVDPDGTVTFTPDKAFTGTGQGVTVVRQDKNGTPVSAKFIPTVTAVTPTGEDATSTGLQGSAQTGNLNFEAGDTSVPLTGYQLVDPNTGQPTADNTLPAVKDGQQVGTYTVNSDGTVTFTPNKDFVGTPDAITVVATDANGTQVRASYAPTVTAVTPTGEDATSTGLQGAEQTGKPTFTEGDASVPMDDNVPATFEDGTTEKVVPGEGTYKVASDGTVTFTPDKSFTGTGQGVTVVRQDKNGTPVSAKFIPTVTAVTPTGEDATSTGLQGATQTGKPTFTEGDASVPMDDDVPATFEDGSTTKTIPGEGIYTVDPDGTVTFTPDKSFTGTGQGVTVVRQDKNGTQVSAKFIPTVTAVTPTGEDATSTGLQGAAQTGNLNFEAGDASVPLTGYQLVDPNTGQPTADNTLPALKDGQQVGTYTVNPDGTVTFTPNKDFVGTPDAITVVATDANGTQVRATYAPTVTAVTPTGQDATSTGLQGATQTGKPTFTEGDASVPMDDDVPATFEDGSTTKTIPGEGVYTVDPNGTVTFTPDKSFTGTGQGVTIVRQDKNGTQVSAKFIPTVTAVTPTGQDVTSTGLQGATQTGKPTFTEGDASVPMDDDVPATFDDGSTTKTIPGEGTYTVSADGTVTFTPDKSFTGTGQGVKVVRQDKNGTKASAKFIPTATAVTPTGQDATSTGLQGAAQTGNLNFEAGDTSVPLTGYQLVDPNTGQPTADNTLPALKDGQQVGTYTVNSDGTVTFTPNKDFVGSPDAVTVVATDANGTQVRATYAPTVTAVTPTGQDATSTGLQGATQTGKPTFTEGDASVPMDDDVPATFEDGSTTKTIPGEGVYTVSPDGTVTFTPDKSFTGTGQGVTIVRQDKNGTPVSAKFIPTVTAVTPTGEDATSTGLQGATQTGKPTFTEGDASVPMDDDVPATFEDGSTTKTIPGEGVYTVSPDGTVTFTPDKSFTGTGQGVTVVRQDKNGTPVSAKFIPTVTAITPTGEDATSTGLQGATQTGKPTFTEGDASVPMDDDVPATFEDGSMTKIIPGEGTYTVSPDGTVTFTPDKSFTGTGQGVTVVRQDKNGTPVSAKFIPTVTAVTPTGEDATSTGLQGATQTGKPTFTEGDASVPMDDDVPATFEDGSTTKTIPGEGTYTVSPDGTVTFTPDKSFTGTGQGVTVVRQDKNGTPVSAKFIPTVTAVTPTSVDASSTGIQGARQTGKPIFIFGDSTVPMDDSVPATFDDGTTEKVIPGEGIYTVAPDGTVTFIPERGFTGTGQGVIVVRQDVNGVLVHGSYIPTVTPSVPNGNPATSQGGPGQAQTGRPVFESTVPMDDTVPATFDDGTTERIVPGEGTYRVAPDGTVTFIPEPGFVGTARGVIVVRQDINGGIIMATYIPTVTAPPVVTVPGQSAQDNRPDPAEQQLPTEVAASAILPQTGDANGFLLPVTGLTVMLFGLTLLRKRKED